MESTFLTFMSTADFEGVLNVTVKVLIVSRAPLKIYIAVSESVYRKM